MALLAPRKEGFLEEVALVDLIHALIQLLFLPFLLSVGPQRSQVPLQDRVATELHTEMLQQDVLLLLSLLKNDSAFLQLV